MKKNLIIIGITIALLFFLVSCTPAPTCPSCEVECKETAIIEFTSPQVLPIRCSSYDLTGEYVKWNSSIRIEDLVGQEYEIINNRLIIYPDFRAYSNYDSYDLNISLSEEPRCTVHKSFVYNITISGKTITETHHINVEDCDAYYNCGIIEQFKKLGG